jgi:predicted nucleotidyltransferase
MNENLARIFQELRDGLIEILGDTVDAVYVFGSQARGDARLDSDIDVLVVMKDEYDYREVSLATAELTADISLKYDVVISKVFVTRKRLEEEQTPFFINVRNEAVEL